MRNIVNVLMSFDNMDGILCTILEGGSNYWIEKIEFVETKPKDMPVSEFVTQQFVKDKPVIVFFSEYNDRSEPFTQVKFTRRKLRKGLRLYLEHLWENRRPLPLDAGDIDATEADLVMQYALFRKLTFS